MTFRVVSLQALQAAGLVIQVNESFGDMAVNASVSPIPVTFISWRHVPEIMVSGTPRARPSRLISGAI